MNCSNCGANNVENFCGECGTAQNTNQAGFGTGQPVVFADTVTAPPVKKKSNVVNILVIVFLSLFTLGSLAFGVMSNGEAERRAALAFDAMDEVEYYNDRAASYDSIYAESVVGRDQCYVNWYCSASTYSDWIDLVNEAEAGANEARADAAIWEATLDAEWSYRATAETNRTIGFALAGLFGVGLIVFIVLMVVRKGKRA
jgi:hypothetical protein